MPSLTDMDVKVGQRAQVVIPAELRRRMGVKDGDVLHAELDERGRLVLEKVEADPVRRLLRAGTGLYDGLDGVDYQRAMRQEWVERGPA